MQRITSTDSLFHDGDPAAGILGTFLAAAWHNAVQEEIASFIESAGIALNPNDNGQLQKAFAARLYGPAGVVNANGATTLATGQINSLVGCSGAGSYAITLPPASECPNGSRFRFFNNSQTGAPTLEPAAGDSIYLGGNAQYVQVLTYTSMVLVSDGNHSWYIESSNVYGYTPPAFTSNNQLATTAYVASMLGNMRGFMVENASAALTNAQAGSVVEITAAAPITITLPTAIGYAGQVFGLYNASNVAHTLSTFGPGEKLNLGPTAVLTNVSVPPWTRALLIGDGTNWIVIGDLQAPYSYTFSNWATAPQFDISGKLVNTTCLQRALGNMSGVTQQNTSGGLLLSAANAGQIIDLQPGFTGNVTLPLSTTLAVGTVVTVYNGTGAPLTVVPSGSDKIYPTGVSLPSISISNGDSMQFVMYGSGGGWIAWAGAAQLQYSPLFGSSLSSVGYQKLPSGLIIQWGASQFSTTGLAVTFPIAFPNACFSVALGNPDSVSVTVATSANTKTGFTGTISAGSAAYIYWIAIGY